MSDRKTIKYFHERRTYLQGTFEGKFIGYLDLKKSDQRHENYYDIEVIEGEIKADFDKITRWHEGGEDPKFSNIDEFITKIPDELPALIKYPDGTAKWFRLSLIQPKLADYTLSRQVYDDQRVFGTISGRFSSFLKHYDEEEIELPPELESPVDGPNEIPEYPKTRTNIPTGRKETNGQHERLEYYYSDGTTYWADWIKIHKSSPATISWEQVTSFISILFFATLLIPILIVGWKFITILVALGSVWYVLSWLRPFIYRIGLWLLRITSFIFLLSLILGIIQVLKGSPWNGQTVATDRLNPKEESFVKLDPNSPGDTIIRHYREWSDYEGRRYEGYINIPMRAVQRSSLTRIGFPLSQAAWSDYDEMINILSEQDDLALNGVYAMFDSIQSVHKFSDTDFACMITSCIQDIPYVMILEESCNPSQYPRSNIRQYLESGGACEGYVKFGLFAPAEFVGNLKGDCDTRALLLYTILAHYGYEVAVLTSPAYMHAVLGINLPVNGLAKIHQGNRFLLWETTAPGFRPGILPRENSDTRLWNVSLISKNQSS